MQIEIRYGQLERSDALARHITEHVEHALRHCEDQFTRVEVHLTDENAHKSGTDDKRCVLEARPRGAKPFVVEGKSDEVYKTVGVAAKKLERAALHWLERHRT